MDVSALRGARAQPFAASRAYAGQRLVLGAKPAQGQARRAAMSCRAVAEAETDMEKRGEASRWRRGLLGGRRSGPCRRHMRCPCVPACGLSCGCLACLAKVHV